MNNLNFKKARASDAKICFNLLKDRVFWMNQKGFNHWNSFDYLSIYPLEHFKRLQTEGSLYILMDENEIVCFGALLEDDPRWQNDDKKCLYLHHFVSKVSKNKYGVEFMYHLFDYALNNGFSYIRLDCTKGYKPLDDYYGKFGFISVGECVEGQYIGTLKEVEIPNKKELRQKIKDRKLDEEYIDTSSLIIEDKVLNSIDYKKARDIFIYLSTNNEVSTSRIIKHALNDSKRVYVPYCEKENMKAILINKDSEFRINKYGILEPLNTQIEAKQIDLAIIPCSSANKSLRRLGHGKGYYDKFLSKHNCKKIVLCFSKQVEEYIPMDKYDIYMDEIITEKN